MHLLRHKAPNASFDLSYKSADHLTQPFRVPGDEGCGGVFPASTDWEIWGYRQLLSGVWDRAPAEMK